MVNLVVIRGQTFLRSLVAAKLDPLLTPSLNCKPLVTRSYHFCEPSPTYALAGVCANCRLLFMLTEIFSNPVLQRLIHCLRVL